MPTTWTSSGSTRRYKPLSLSPSRSSSDTSKERDVPERIDLNRIVGDVTGTGMQAFELIGRAPARVAEMPVSAIDTVVKKTTGFEPVKWVEQTVGGIPILGDVIGRAGDVADMGDNLVGSFFNSGAARLLREHANDADDTSLNPLESLQYHRVWLPWDVPTVGELRRDAAGMGFTGRDIDDLVAGRKGDFDFGDKTIGNNQVTDFALRVLFDPTNLVFGAGAAKNAVTKLPKLLLKLAGMNAPVPESIGLWNRLSSSGKVSKALPDATRAGAAWAEGNSALATWKGLGNYLQRSAKFMLDPRGYTTTKGYMKRATALSAVTVGGDVTLDWTQGLSDDVPLIGPLKGIHELANAIIEDKPFSDNAAFVLLSAVKYPMREIVGGANQERKVLQYAAMGQRHEQLFANKFGFTGKDAVKRWHEFMGGEQVARGIVQTAMDNIVTKRHKILNVREFDSVDSAVVRQAGLRQVTDAARKRMLKEADSALSPDRVWKAYEEFDGHLDFNAKLEYIPDPEGPIVRRTLTKAGEETEQRLRKSVTVLDEADVLPVRGYFDPAAARDRYTHYRTVTDQVGRVLGDRAASIVPEIRTVYWQERIDDVLAELQVAAKGGVIDNAELRRVMLENRPLLAQDPTLRNWTLKAARVTPEEAAEKLNALREDAPSLAEVLAECGMAEKTAAGLTPTGKGAEPVTPTDTGFVGNLPIKSLGDDIDAQTVAQIREMEAWLVQNAPEYTLANAPKLTLLPPATTEIGQVLRQQTLLSNIIHTFGPTSAFGRFTEWLTQPVEGSWLSRQAKQATFEEFSRLGISTGETDKILASLGKHVETSMVTKSVPLFRGVTGLTPATIEGLAREVLGEAGTKIADGAISKALDRAHSRYWRTVTAAAEKPGTKGSLGRALRTVYKGTQNVPGSSVIRYTKSFYPIFRFMADPRWWAMNKFEASILETGRAGRRQRANPDMPISSATYATATNKVPTLEEVQSGAVKGLAPIPEEAQPLLGRNYQEHIARTFDAERVDGVERVLNSLADSDPVIQKLREMMPDASARTWAEQIDDMLYAFDRKGVRATVESEAKKAFDATTIGKMRPFLERMIEQNQRTFSDISGYFLGNPARTNMERLANNYWLYWPASYQLKAGKWLYDMMTDRMLGFQTNVGPAAKYAQMLAYHKDKMVSDPEYAQMFEDNPTLWFAAQMFLPITPGDLGVSLSRLPRYVGAELGYWETYQANDDPITLLTKVAEMGPIYTAELMSRARQDEFMKDLFQK